MRRSSLAVIPCDFLIDTLGASSIVIPVTRRAKMFTRKELRPHVGQWVHGTEKLVGFVVSHAQGQHIAAMLREGEFEVHFR